MTTFSLPIVRRRLAQLSAHLVVAVVALVVIGSLLRNAFAWQTDECPGFSGMVPQA